LPSNGANGFGKSQRNYDKYHELSGASNTGPGAYDYQLPNGRGFIIGKEQRPELKQDNPGPGVYNPIED